MHSWLSAEQKSLQVVTQNQEYTAIMLSRFLFAALRLVHIHFVKSASLGHTADEGVMHRSAVLCWSSAWCASGRGPQTMGLLSPAALLSAGADADAEAVMRKAVDSVLPRASCLPTSSPSTEPNAGLRVRASSPCRSQTRTPSRKSATTLSIQADPNGQAPAAKHDTKPVRHVWVSC